MVISLFSTPPQFAPLLTESLATYRASPGRHPGGRGQERAGMVGVTTVASRNGVAPAGYPAALTVLDSQLER